MKLGKKTQLGVAILVLFGIAFFAVGPFNITARANTDTDVNFAATDGNCDSDGIRWKGQYPDPAGADTRKYGELLSTSTIWTSWTPLGESRDITVAAEVAETCGNILPELFVYYKALRYNFFVDNGNGFIPFVSQDVPQGFIELSISAQPLANWISGEVPLKVFTTQIDGNSICADRTNRLHTI